MKRSLAVTVISLLAAAAVALGAVCLVSSSRNANTIDALNNSVSARDGQISALSAEVETLQADVAGKVAEIESLQADVKSKDGQIAVLVNDVAEKNGQIAALKADQEKSADRIAALEADVREKSGEIEALKNEAAESAGRIESLSLEVQEKDGQIRLLEEEKNRVAARSGDPAAQAPVEKQYAGATPVPIYPVSPSPTPLPPLTFTYEKYEAKALGLSFEAPAGWIPDDSRPDTFTLTDPHPFLDYAASLSIRTVSVDREYTVSDLAGEIRETLSGYGSNGFVEFRYSNTARHRFMDTDAVYASYAGTTGRGAMIGGRLVITCSGHKLYILDVSYPEEYTREYLSGVYDRFRFTVRQAGSGS